MKADEILIVAVIVMLIASTYMGYCVQRNLHHSQKAFEALIIEFNSLARSALSLDDEVRALKRRVAELER